MFMRDAKQAEVLLSQQDNLLSKEEVPVSYLAPFTIRLGRVEMTVPMLCMSWLRNHDLCSHDHVDVNHQPVKSYFHRA